MTVERKELQPLIENVYDMDAAGQVYFINEIFGNKFGGNTQDKVIAQTENIYDEAEEFVKDGLEHNNRKEVIDAIGDLLTFGYGIGYLLGLDSKVVYNYDYYENRPDITNEQMIRLVVYQTDELIDALNLKDGKDYLKEYEKLMGLIKTLCTLNDVGEDRLMTRITVSNLTKICSTFDECQATIDKYTDIGVDVYSKYFKVQGNWIHVVYSSKEQVVKGKMYRPHKFLKCIYFKEPVLDDLV
jgi:hypothetical protein